jgi:hypothetical protein
MGRIVDVIVSQDGSYPRRHHRLRRIPRHRHSARSRSIGARLKILRPQAGITLELTRNQVRVAPEYKRGEPLVVLGPASRQPERTAPSTDAATPEK